MTAALVFFAADHFGKQAQQVRKLRDAVDRIPARAAPDERLAVFSDSLEQVDGVSTWCKRFVARARAAGRDGAASLVPARHAGDDGYRLSRRSRCRSTRACASTCRR